MTVDRLKMHSPDLAQRNIDAIGELFPAVVTETLDADGNPVRAVDFDALRQELSDHLVEGPQERYQLDWPGKRAAAFAANAPIAKTLRPMREESVDFDTTKNLFIEGDNLDALKLLQESYLGRVKLIYIDPPYNTGNDFVYEDDFAESTSDFLRRSGQQSGTGDRLVANTEANGRFHSDWLSMMYPRLRLSRSLLADDGLIICSIDSHEVANLISIMCEIFGSQNEIASVPVIMNLKGNQDAFAFADSHEYLVVWARNRAKCRVGAFPVDSAAIDDWESDEYGPYKRADTLRRTGADASRARRPNGWFPVFIDSERKVYVTSDDQPLKSQDIQLWPVNDAGEELSWTWSKTKIQEDAHNLLVVNGRSGPSIYKKQRPQLGEMATSKPKSVLYSSEYSSSSSTAYLKNLMGSKLFDNPKPVPLLRDLLRIGAPGRDDLVLDFFAGSASMADAVMRVNAADGGNRRFILIQIGEAVPSDSAAAEAGYRSIASLGRARCRAAAESVTAGHCDSQWRGDVGFRALKVDTTNMNDVLRMPDETDQQLIAGHKNSVKQDRTSDDLLFQVLLDWGLDLSAPISREHIGEGVLFVVDDGALVACFDRTLTPELLRAVAAREPLRAVLLDSAFASDAARINAGQIFREVSPRTEVRAI